MNLIHKSKTMETVAKLLRSKRHSRSVKVRRRSWENRTPTDHISGLTAVFLPRSRCNNITLKLTELEIWQLLHADDYDAFSESHFCSWLEGEEEVYRLHNDRENEHRSVKYLHLHERKIWCGILQVQRLKKTMSASHLNTWRLVVHWGVDPYGFCRFLGCPVRWGSWRTSCIIRGAQVWLVGPLILVWPPVGMEMERTIVGRGVNAFSLPTCPIWTFGLGPLWVQRGVGCPQLLVFWRAGCGPVPRGPLVLDHSQGE